MSEAKTAGDAATTAALYADYNAALVASREAAARLQAAVEAEIRAEMNGEWEALDSCTFLHWLQGEHGLRYWLVLTKHFAEDDWRARYHYGTQAGESDNIYADLRAAASGGTPSTAIWAMIGTMKIPPLRSHEITSLIRQAP